MRKNVNFIITCVKKLTRADLNTYIYFIFCYSFSKQIPNRLFLQCFLAKQTLKKQNENLQKILENCFIKR